MRKVINVQQGSPEWHALRKSVHGTASEYPAAAGHSKYMQRTELLKQKHTGIVKEVDAATQRRFDKGHASEAAARPIAEKIIGDGLAPVTVTLEIDGLTLLASVDGITFDDEILFEHKDWNSSLADSIAMVNETGNPAHLHDHYKDQMDQQLLVTGGKKVLFMTSDGTENNMAWCWYYADPERMRAVTAVWKQFHKDLAAYAPVEVAEVAPATPAEAFPVPSVVVRGELVACNLDEITPRFDKFLNETNTDLKTDEDFAQGESDAKASREASKVLKLKVKEVIDQIAPVSEVVRTLEGYAAKFDALGLKLEKAVKDQKESIKTAIAANARAEFTAHVAALNAELGVVILRIDVPDFGGAMKNKRTIESLYEAVGTLLSQSKVSADKLAMEYRKKMEWFKGESAGYRELFADLQSLIEKPMDDFRLSVQSRIEKQKAAEAARAAEAQAAAMTNPASIVQEAALQSEPEKPVATIDKAAQQQSVVEHQDEIAEFMRSRDFGKESNKVRAILVEFVKFQAARSLKAAA